MSFFPHEQKANQPSKISPIKSVPTYQSIFNIYFYILLQTAFQLSKGHFKDLHKKNFLVIMKTQIFQLKHGFRSHFPCCFNCREKLDPWFYVNFRNFTSH